MANCNRRDAVKLTDKRGSSAAGPKPGRISFTPKLGAGANADRCTILYNAMISLAGIIGKCLEFVVTKLAEHRLELSLDQRKRAARAFVEFHSAVGELETLTREFVDVLERVRTEEKTRIYAAWVKGFQPRVDHATAEFFRISDSLLRVLMMLDPVLASAVAHVSIRKLHAAAAVSRLFADAPLMFRLNWRLPEEQGLQSISFHIPPNELDWLDVRKLYEVARERFGPHPRYATVDLDLLGELSAGRLIDLSFQPTDRDAIAMAAEVLHVHVAILATARELLRAFIAERFTLEDLLYVSRRRL